jgi:hypothetical protein
MKVARQFIAWDVRKKVTVPEGRCERRYPMYWLPQVEERPTDPIIPSLRDGSPFWTSQAINCLATIIQSLRDNKPPLPVHIFESTSPILRSPGFEDEDEDSGSTELAEVLSDVAFCSRCLAVLSASEVGRTKRLARTHRALALLIAGQGAAELIH